METNEENFHFHLGTGRATVITMLETWPCCLVFFYLLFVLTQAGASGALFGLIGLLIIKLLQFRHEVKRPCVEVLILLGVLLVSFGKLCN